MLRDTLRAQLAEVAAQWRVPIVMITHDIDDVLALAHVAFVIERGTVVREVDVRRAEAREATRALMPQHVAVQRDPHGQRVCELLRVSVEG
jgi:molybdate transport system ATP-binding protein